MGWFALHDQEKAGGRDIIIEGQVMDWVCITQTQGTNVGGNAKSINIMGFKELHGGVITMKCEKTI